MEKDMMIFSSDACNRLRKGFGLDGGDNRLSFNPILATLIACRNLEAEDKFLTSVGHVTQYEMKNDSLKLFNAAKTELATFMEIENPFDN